MRPGTFRAAAPSGFQGGASSLPSSRRQRSSRSGRRRRAPLRERRRLSYPPSGRSRGIPPEAPDPNRLRRRRTTWRAPEGACRFRTLGSDRYRKRRKKRRLDRRAPSVGASGCGSPVSRAKIIRAAYTFRACLARALPDGSPAIFLGLHAFPLPSSQPRKP